MIDIQTLEEAAIKELNNSYAAIIEGELVYNRFAMLNMFRKGAYWQSQNMWIKVEDEKPDKNQTVLANYIFINPRNEMEYGFGTLIYRGTDLWQAGILAYRGLEASRDDIKITHWAPIMPIID